MADQIYPLVQYNPVGGPSTAQPLSGTRDAAARVGMTNTRYEDLVSQGQGWMTMTVTAAAAVVVRPSTLAHLEVFNGNAVGSNVALVVDRLMAWNLVSTAVNSNAGIWAQVTTAKAAPSSAALAISGNYGRAYAGAAINAIGTTVVANGWYPFGPFYSAPNAAAPGGAWEALVEGRLIVPPQASLCVTIAGSIAGDTYTCGAAWFERVLPTP